MNTPSYMDILNGVPLTPTKVSEVGGTVIPPAPLPPIGTNPVLERFRTATTNMQITAGNAIRMEIERIIGMPIITDPTQHEIDAISKYYVPDEAFKLYPVQVKAMMQYHDYGGLICPIPVGGGKTLVSVLIANDAFVHFGKRRIILMNPPNLIDQLRDTELPFYRRHISINVPIYWIAGKNAGKRMMLAKSKRAGLYVISYSLLSGAQGAEILDAIEPDLIIGDEIQSIASSNVSARGRRFKNAVKKFSPQLVGLSGTITKKSPRDYHFLVVNALQENSFMPRPNNIAEEWSKIIDCNACSIDEFHPNSAPQPGPIMPLIDWAKKNFPELLDNNNKTIFQNNLIGFSASYAIRLKTTPGVVAAEGDQLGIALRITNIDSLNKHEYSSTLKDEDSHGYKELKRLVKQLTEEWVAPNGDEIEHAMHIWRWRYELEGFGFYNNLFWPTAEKVALKRGISVPDATGILDRSKEHHGLDQEFLKLLRKWISKKGRKSLDTKFLICGDMYRNGAANVGHELYMTYCQVREANFEGIIEREKEIVRVCDFRVNKIVEWAKKWHKKHPNNGAIIWVKNRGVAEWLRDKFIAEDLPMLYCPAGKKGKANLEDRTRGNMFAIASISSYYKGLNLQYHHYAEFYAQFPREAHIAEQSLGRVHRNEQPKDECRIFGSWDSEFDRVLLASCLNDAAYIHQTTQKQKLLYADWDERPKIVPYAVLMEWGTQAEQLDTRAQKLLEDKFRGK